MDVEDDAGDGAAQAELPARRGLRDHPLGKVALLALVLLAAVAVARTCGSPQQDVSREEAEEIAIEQAGFEPCAARQCRQVRALRRGIPSRLYWVVGLARGVDADGEPTGTRTFIVDVTTGEVTESR